MDDIEKSQHSKLEKLLVKRPSRDALIEKGILLPPDPEQKTPRVIDAIKKRKGSLTSKGIERIRSLSFGKKRSPEKRKDEKSPAASPDTPRNRVSSLGPKPTSFEITSTITMRDRSGTIEGSHSPKKIPIIVRLDLKTPLGRSTGFADQRSRSFTIHPLLKGESRTSTFKIYNFLILNSVTTPRPICTPRTAARLMPNKPDLSFAVIKAQSIIRGKRERKKYQEMRKFKSSSMANMSQ
jgi:hypothetical protein